MHHNGHIVFDRWWRDIEKESLKNSDQPHQLAEIANVWILPRMAIHLKTIVVIYGPSTTGLLGNHHAHHRRFDHAVETLEKKGFLVFDQRPFEQMMTKIAATRSKHHEDCDAIFAEFHVPVLESRLVQKGFFLQDWHHSPWAVSGKKHIVARELPHEDLHIEVVESVHHHPTLEHHQ